MAANITQEQSYAYAELLEILSFIDTSLIRKIPNKLMNIFQENASTSYKRHLDKTMPIENQNISKKTAALITLLSLNYWCESESEKAKIKETLNSNAKLHEKQLRETYNPDNIFNNNIEQTTNSFIEDIKPQEIISKDSEESFEEPTNLPLDYSNLNWFQKIILKAKNFISQIFNKNK